MFQALDSMGESLSAYMDATNQSFPFLTHPTFEIIASHARQLSGVETLGYVPFVLEKDRTAWEKYSVEHQGWIEESRVSNRLLSFRNVPNKYL